MAYSNLCQGDTKNPFYVLDNPFLTQEMIDNYSQAEVD